MADSVLSTYPKLMDSSLLCSHCPRPFCLPFYTHLSTLASLIPHLVFLLLLWPLSFYQIGWLFTLFPGSVCQGPPVLPLTLPLFSSCTPMVVNTPSCGWFPPVHLYLRFLLCTHACCHLLSNCRMSNHLKIYFSNDSSWFPITCVSLSTFPISVQWPSKSAWSPRL